MIKKELYAAPSTEVLELTPESGVLATVSRGNVEATYDGGTDDWYTE